jgi:non-specific serine/threonine protein kinase
MIGKTLSHYNITEELGRGGMGVVYKAEDTNLKRDVAIKLLPGEIAADADEQKRFRIEAQAAAALNHPNITTIHSIEEAGGQIFIVMEYVDGQELKRMLRQGPMDLEKALAIASQVVDGLAAAHEKSVIHRDIKSANILVTTAGHAKIMDFGLAKLGAVSQLTKSRTTIGTISYMSPEQIQASEVDHRTDLWSFGVLMYEMLTGELPFKGDYEAAIIYEILNSEPKAIQAFRSDVPAHVVSLVSELLQKDPAQRISTAREVIDRLEGRAPEKKKKDEKKSIAVLYFENMSSEKENEYFCAGMTEDLIIDLSKIQGLRIIPRSDILPFRSQEVNSRRVGKTLGVDYILEGSVRKAANRIRIAAQLVDVRSGFQVWGERYDRLIEDIFDVQIEVSEKIAEALKVSLTDSEKKSLAKKPTDDLRAYDFYMRGSDYLSLRWEKDRNIAVQMFEHALSIDPNFALAYVSLAEAYSYNYLFYGGDREWLEKMMEMNEKALSIDPDMIEAQFGVGVAYVLQKRFDKARGEFEKVIVSKSDFYPAHFWLIWTLILLEDMDAAITYLKKAQALKPYSEEPWHLLEFCLRKKGELEAADEAGNKVIELSLRKLEINSNDAIARSRMAIAYANKGKRKEALAELETIEEIDPEDGMAFYNCGSAYSILGIKDKGLALLQAAIKKGTSTFIEWVEHDPYLDSLRDLPEFREMMRKIGV